MAYVTLTVEGGLFPTDLLERIALGQVAGQHVADFGPDVSGRLSDEIQAAFSDASAYWDAFRRRRAHSHESATTLTRESWVIPLLERLGFSLTFQRAAAQVGDETYFISHRAGDGPDAPPVHVVAVDQPLDRRAEGGRRSPYALVQEYLNRSDALWGLVSNGEHLRLLRASAKLAGPTYVDFDLQALIEGNHYNEFVLLYRLLHRSRLPRGGADAPECLLEKYYQQGIEEGGRVREHLRDGVEAALVELGTAFLVHPTSEGLRERFRRGHLDAEGYYRQLLRLVCRLLFLFVVEERRLIYPLGVQNAGRQDVYARHYSVSRLRERCERYFADDHHADLWQGLCQTFYLFRDSHAAAQLGMAALDGELFGHEACRDLEGAGCENARLLRAMLALSTFVDNRVRRRVNYAGLDVEELGSVYESLLDFQPHVSLDGEPRFALLAGSERKRTGSYYTPPELVRELIDSALVPVLDERLGQGKTDAEKEARLLSLRVCDPAAGSGHFLLAAARRLGRELARLRSRQEEPPPNYYREAVREVIRTCICAVDKNPLAVDLCKVALWIEGHEPGLPLSFLDHHVKCGDSLVGVFDLKALREGIPDGAYAPVTGDDKAAASFYKKRNKAEREGQISLDSALGASSLPAKLAADFASLAMLDDRTPDDFHAKRELYDDLRGTDAWRDLKVACDLWTAAFFMPLRLPAALGRDAVPTTELVRRALQHPAGIPQQLAGEAVALGERLRFFHWPLEFLDVFDAGGFDCVLGNPPWERIKLQEQEFFAGRDPAIAKAPNKAARQKLIDALPKTDPALAQAFAEAKRDAEAQSKFVRQSGRFPLTAVGDVNVYALFAELVRRLANPGGRAGVVIPTGIATDDTTKDFFADLADRGALATLFDFENRKPYFPDVDSRYKFCLLTMAGSRVARGDFAFFLTDVVQLHDAKRRFQLMPEDFALLNPNTRTCPVFRTKEDAELTKAIYRRVPVLVNERTGENPWGIQFLRMFDMSNDSHLFRTAEQLAREGWRQVGNAWERGGERYLPLYEAKMFHHYNHRWATYEKGDFRDVASAEMMDPGFAVWPRYWVPETEVLDRLGSQVPEAIWQTYVRGDVKLMSQALGLWLSGYLLNRGQKTFGNAVLDRMFGTHYIEAHIIHGPAVQRMEVDYPLGESDLALIRQHETIPDMVSALVNARRPRWLLAFRDITNATNERTAILCALPRVGLGNNAPLVVARKARGRLAAGLVGSLASLAFDYAVRPKIGGTHLNFFVVNQLPVLPPSAYTEQDLDFITPRVLELTYTAWDLQPFARDLGYEGPPFPWDEERRALLRAELDAYYAALYGLTRDELRYILDPTDVHGPDFPGETFRVLKEKEIRQYGEYRTKRLVLEAWDRLGLAPRNRDGRYGTDPPGMPIGNTKPPKAGCPAAAAPGAGPSPRGKPSPAEPGPAWPNPRPTLPGMPPLQPSFGDLIEEAGPQQELPSKRGEA